jgi:hypothetical protein
MGEKPRAETVTPCLAHQDPVRLSPSALSPAFLRFILSCLDLNARVP